MTTWICELNREEVKLMAALVHDYLQTNSNPVASKLLDHLIEQTENMVSRDPEKHRWDTIPDRPLPELKLVERLVSGFGDL